MKSTLVFTLGRGQKADGSRYRTATYLFGDGHLSSPSPFFGLCLLHWLTTVRGKPPESVVVLGSRSSMWDALVEMKGVDMEDDEFTLYEQLAEKVETGSVTDSDLVPLAAWLHRVFQHKFLLRVIPEGVDHTGQMSILEILAETVPHNASLHMCVTHGLRHMPMLQMLSAFQLAQTHNVSLAGLYYGALELGQASHRCPVIELTGAADIQKWNLALAAVSQTGRLHPLAEATQVEAPELSREIGDCAYRLALNQTARAAAPASRVIKTLSKSPLPGAGKLFTRAAAALLAWADHSALWEKQRLLACQTLKTGDVLRTALLCIEAIVSKSLPAETNPTDYSRREKAWQDLLDHFKNYDPQARKDLKTLEYLRNSLAHDSATASTPVSDLLASQQKLQAFLERMLKFTKSFTPPR